MIKQLIALLVFSTLIVLTMPYTQQGVQYLLDAHEWISTLLTDVFSGGQAGNLLRGLIALLSVPVIVGLIPAIFYWLIKRSWFPYFMETFWVVWLIQAGALAIAFKTAIS